MSKPPTNSFEFVSRPEWKELVLPKFLREKPIHRWLVFPHSYDAKLVEDLIDMWSLDNNSCILDPFCGAGTTLLAAKNRGILAKGYDISPFSVFVSNAKTAIYDFHKLENAWRKICSKLYDNIQQCCYKSYPDLVCKAFSAEILNALEHIECTILKFTANKKELNFFRLALFSILPSVSRAVATGGWLKWVGNQDTCKSLFMRYTRSVENMLADVKNYTNSKVNNYAHIGDARYLDAIDSEFSAIITSPPYPNRHDYTRVFGVELMYGFLDWEDTRALRYQSFHSHPESKPHRPNYSGYIPPEQLLSSLTKIRKLCSRKRIITMIEGYFIDMYCSLKEIARVCMKNGNVAMVLGNARYHGELLLVDEITANIGEQVGLTCEKIIVSRVRGNSAQQMKKYGRKPSRESVIVFKNRN